MFNIYIFTHFTFKVCMKYKFIPSTFLMHVINLIVHNSFIHMFEYCLPYFIIKMLKCQTFLCWCMLNYPFYTDVHPNIQKKKSLQPLHCYFKWGTLFFITSLIENMFKSCSPWLTGGCLQAQVKGWLSCLLQCKSIFKYLPSNSLITLKIYHISPQ